MAQTVPDDPIKSRRQPRSRATAKPPSPGAAPAAQETSGGALGAGASLRATRAAAAAARLHPLVPIFLISLLIPAVFSVAGLRLSTYRALLLVSVLPLALQLISGRAGRLHACDALVFAFALWMVVAILVNHGFAEIEGVGAYSLEVIGAYLIGRTLVRNEAHFAATARWIVRLVAFLTPVMAFEAFTGVRLVNAVFDLIAQTLPSANMEPRWGLERAQGSFDHPILAGVFCSVGVAFALMLSGSAPGPSFVGVIKGAFLTLAVFFTLSAGAYFALIAQFGLLAWERATRSVPRRWLLLIAMFALGMLALTIVSGRSPFAIFATYFSFNAHNAWMRINIFEHVIDDILGSPIIGIGFNDWTRPNWMLASVDNFWLVIAMRYGLTGLVLFVTLIVLVMTSIGGNAVLGPQAVWQRNALLFSLVGLFVSATTVFFWNSTFVFLMFLLGSGVWMIDDRSALTRSARAPVGARSLRRSAAV